MPRNQGALFREMAQTLWEREEEYKTPGWIPFEEAEAAFGRLAFAMIDEDRPIDMPLSYAVDKIGSRELLLTGASASFVTMNGDYVCFYHQSLRNLLKQLVRQKPLPQPKHGANHRNDFYSATTRRFPSWLMALGAI